MCGSQTFCRRLVTRFARLCNVFCVWIPNFLASSQISKHSLRSLVYSVLCVDHNFLGVLVTRVYSVITPRSATAHDFFGTLFYIVVD